MKCKKKEKNPDKKQPPMQKAALTPDELKAICIFMRRAYTSDFDEAEALRVILSKIQNLITTG